MKDNKKKTTEEETAVVGSVKIADEVVGMIASIATTEVEGVHGMAGNVPAELMDRVGVKTPGRGVKVDVRNKKVNVDIAIVMEYGYNIPTTCQKVQDKVKSAIENMTGLKVTDVNVRISGISVPAK